MARAEEPEEDFGLPLRAWLVKRIDSDTYPNLRWDGDVGEGKYFRVPWGHKDTPEGKESFKLFQAWADHKGRSDQYANNLHRLKSNFRSALQKSDDFEEIPSRAVSDRQTGNYRVFRIVSPKEVLEKKEARRKEKAVRDSNINDNKKKRIGKKKLAVLDNLGASSSCSHSLNIDNSAGSGTFSLQPDNITPGLVISPPDDIPRDITVIRPPNLDSFDLDTSIPAAIPVLATNWDQPQQLAADEGNLIIGPYDNRVEYARLLQAMDIPPTDYERFSECRIIVSYNSDVMLEKNITDLSRGCRIFYGDQNEQIRLLRTHETSDENLFDFRLEGIQLPTVSELSHVMSAILNKAGLGIVIDFDPATQQLFAKRLCQCQTFIFDAHDPNSISHPKKLERREKVPIFSFYRFVSEHFDCRSSSSNSKPPKVDIILVVGVKPKSRMTLPAMKGLKIELIPYVVEYFSNKCNENSTLCYSDPSSMEKLLRS